MFTIDGITWDYPCSIERVAEMTPSEISGMLLDKSYFNDVIGTYMQYTIRMAVPLDNRDKYETIYEALTEPVEGHTFVLPYNYSTITIVGRVESISDVYVRLPNGGAYWKGIQFTVVANSPSKEMGLTETITRGRSPMPDSATVEVGDVYERTANGWVKRNYADADNISY